MKGTFFNHGVLQIVNSVLLCSFLHSHGLSYLQVTPNPRWFLSASPSFLCSAQSHRRLGFCTSSSTSLSCRSCGNNLTGTLPLEMSNLTSIKLFYMSCNSLSCSIPESMVVGMEGLEVLDLYYNNLTGELPTELENLAKLWVLHLGGNYFYGSIPKAYSRIRSLVSLGLQGNGLTGKIPWSLAKLPNLQELLLCYFNEYEEGIPPDFGSLSSLRLLDLGGCNLSGEIPRSLGNLKLLQSLFLQKNQLTGHMPRNQHCPSFTGHSCSIFQGPFFRRKPPALLADESALSITRRSRKPCTNAYDMEVSCPCYDCIFVNVTRDYSYVVSCRSCIDFNKEDKL